MTVFILTQKGKYFNTLSLIRNIVSYVRNSTIRGVGPAQVTLVSLRKNAMSLTRSPDNAFFLPPRFHGFGVWRARMDKAGIEEA